MKPEGSFGSSTPENPMPYYFIMLLLNYAWLKHISLEALKHQDLKTSVGGFVPMANPSPKAQTSNIPDQPNFRGQYI